MTAGNLAGYCGLTLPAASPNHEASPMRLRRATTSLVAAFSLGVAQGCVTYAHPRPMSLPAGTDAVLTSGAEPMRVMFPSASVGAERITCRASRIDGYSTASRADTVPFAWIAVVVAATVAVIATRLTA